MKCDCCGEDSTILYDVMSGLSHREICEKCLELWGADKETINWIKENKTQTTVRRSKKENV